MAAGYGGGILRIDPTTGSVSTLIARNACSSLTSADGGGLLYYSYLVTATPGGRDHYYTVRNGGGWGVTDVSGPMAVAPANTGTVPVVPASWGSVKARYR